MRGLGGGRRSSQALLVHAAVILHSAVRAAVIDPSDFDHQIRPRLQDAQAAWGDVAATWPSQMTTLMQPSLAGVEASAELHRALGEITRDCNGWATPAQIAERVHLGDVAGLLRDAVAAQGPRAERFAELPTELAHAGHLYAPARLLAAMEGRVSGRGLGSESAVRTTDVANRRIVIVRPEQTADATATARHLGRQLASLTAALETVPLGSQSFAVVDPSSTQSAALGARPARPARATPQLTRQATISR